MKRYYLGFAAHLSGREVLRHTFTVGREKHRRKLKDYLSQKYDGDAVLTKNCRSALTLALIANLQPGDGVIVNGLTCYAVIEAIRAAKMVPVYADVNRKNLNFDVKTLTNALSRTPARGIIIQNTLGNPVDILEIEQFAKKHNLMIIEDLAHCTGVKYPDGREAGTVGIATVLSFGKDKSIDTTSGGAVIFRNTANTDGELPSASPRFSDVARARFYPMFGAMIRGLNRVHLGGALQNLLLKMHWMEKSADNKLDLNCKIAKFEAKLALEQLKGLKKSGEPALRDFVLVRSRDEALDKLRKAGYYFDGFWYDVPVIPKRYYHKVHFPEADCPVATELSQKMLNLPTWYSKKELATARKILQEYLEESK